jgi:glutamate dehydrogenase
MAPSHSNLGIDDMYFQMESVESIASHIMALYGAKIFAYTKNDHALDINLERETDEGAVYIHNSLPGVTELAGPEHEKKWVHGFVFTLLSKILDLAPGLLTQT